MTICMHAYTSGTVIYMGANLWAIYVQAVAPREGRREKEGRRQAEVGKRAGVSQSTISRWRSGEVARPQDPGTVAAFAKAYDRNVLEAFVAADMLEEADAGRGLSAASRRFLALLREVPTDVDVRVYLASIGELGSLPQGHEENPGRSAEGA